MLHSNPDTSSSRIEDVLIPVLSDNDHRPPYVGSVEQYVAALKVVDLSSCERDMLRAHFYAPEQRITGTELAASAGHFGSRIGHKKYGRVGRKIALAAGLPHCPSDVSDYLAAIFTLADGTQMESEDWCWTLHPTVAQALRACGYV
ncbi:hypothetical protein [Thalassospira profundimaris]|uniref:hypothetical protein n=1 Tax=Thalassospira profundimaris TaxID=502049 RepID=UPI00215DB1BB|nr:hypothetical protein [Thalassospira profundimaris]